MDIQTRFLARPDLASIRVTRADDAKSDVMPQISGYAAVFYDENDSGTEYQMWDDVVERIMPGAFDEALARPDDVRGLFNHDPDHILGRTASGTLTLSVDERGLWYVIDPPDTEMARSLVMAIERGDVSGASFGFVPGKTVFVDDDDEDMLVIERHMVTLWDVSPVTYPAFESATSGTRSGGSGDVPAEVDQWRRRKQSGRAAREAAAARASARVAEIAE